MALTRDRIQHNLEDVQQRIQRAAERGRRLPESIQLIAVTKSVGLEEALILRDLGVTDFGENRVEQALPKVQFMRDVQWHMIGSVQRRKAHDIVAHFDCVDSVDRLELAETLQHRCEELDKRLPVLLEVNVSGEASKHGFIPARLEEILTLMKRFERLDVRGFMTMAPFVEDAETIRPVFSQLRLLAEHFGLSELSMGMSNDYEVAIEEGATQVRVGSALFA